MQGSKHKLARDVVVDDEAPVNKRKGLIFQSRSPRTHCQQVRNKGSLGSQLGEFVPHAVLEANAGYGERHRLLSTRAHTMRRSILRSARVTSKLVPAMRE